MIRVLVTGATGFVGRQAVAALTTAGAEVHGCGRTPPGDFAGAQWHTCDLVGPDAPRRLIETVRPSHLLHAAWTIEHGRFWTDLANLDWLAASMALLRAFVDASGQRFVGIGTSAEYAPRTEPLGEDSAIAPATLYGTVKHSLHQVAAQLAADGKLSYAWGRLFLLIGPHETRTRLVPYVITRLLAGEPAECSSGEQRLDFMDVRDAGAALAALLLSDVDGPVNVASGRSIAVSEVVRRLGGMIGRPDLVRLGARSESWQGPKHLDVAVDRLRDELGFVPCFTLEDTLMNSVAWWRGQLHDEVCR